MARLLTPSSRAAQTAKDLPTVTCAFLYQYTFIAGARSLGALRQPRDDTTKALYPLRIRGTSSRVALRFCFLNQGAKHDVDVYEPELAMSKRAGQRSYDLEPKALPEGNGRSVCGDDEVELHPAKALPARLHQAMLSHRAPEAVTLGER